MNNDIDIFLKQAKERGLTNQQIIDTLVKNGWSTADAQNAVAVNDFHVPAPPKHSAQMVQSNATKTSDAGMTISSNGLRFEYRMMFLSMWIAALAIIWIFNVFLFSNDSTLITFPLTALLVTAPIFMILFFRVRAQEKKEPIILKDKERRNTIQSTLSLSFFILVVHTIIALYQLLSGSDSVSSQLLSLLGTYITFGGIFIYFWKDTHQN